MEHNHFAVLRERLEEQLRADVELLYEAHRVKLRAFETVWRAQAELDPSLQPPQPAAAGTRQKIVTLLPSGPATREAPSEKPLAQERRELADVVLDVLNALPSVFDKHDVHRLLGFTPSTSSMHRALMRLIELEMIEVAEQGTGRTGNKYRSLKRVKD
jgi:hypothetical protein